MTPFFKSGGFLGHSTPFYKKKHVFGHMFKFNEHIPLNSLLCLVHETGEASDDGVSGGGVRDVSTVGVDEVCEPTGVSHQACTHRRT